MYMKNVDLYVTEGELFAILSKAKCMYFIYYR